MSGTPLWTSDEVALATGGRSSGPWTATGVSIDSRTIAPGDLFVALRGPDHDGHDYVGHALECGACGGNDLASAGRCGEWCKSADRR